MDVNGLPHDDGAERIVLGAMMLDPAAAVVGVDLLRGEDFYRSAHAAIFERIAQGVLDREPVDAAATAARLGPDLQRVGGGAFLHDLIACVPVAANISWYARIVADRALMRRLAQAGQAIVHIGLDVSREPGDAIALAAKHLAAVSDVRHGGGPVRWREVIGPALASIEQASQAGATPGLSTGLALLDAMTGGLRGGQLVVVAGRPGMGKSVVALDWARRAAFHAGVAAVVFSLEMGRNEMFNRLMAAESQTSLARITRGWLDESQWTAIVRVAGATETAPLYIDDVAPVRLHDVVARARRLHACDRLGLIVVDYLQLLTTGGRAESREREVSEISRTLKTQASTVTRRSRQAAGQPSGSTMPGGWRGTRKPAGALKSTRSPKAVPRCRWSPSHTLLPTLSRPCATATWWLKAVGPGETCRCAT
jgi:replicative DNA helicase